MYINHTKTQDLFSTYQIEYCCANAERYSFCDLLDIDKSRQITLRFLNLNLNLNLNFTGVFPTKKFNISAYLQIRLNGCVKIFFSKRKLPQLANFYHVYDQVQNTLKALFYYHFVNYGLYQTEKKTKEGGSQKSSFRFLSDFNFFYINKKWFLFVCWFGFFAFFFTLFICRI